VRRLRRGVGVRRLPVRPMAMEVAYTQPQRHRPIAGSGGRACEPWLGAPAVCYNPFSINLVDLDERKGLARICRCVNSAGDRDRTRW
jgi:hypothetical protein